MKKDKTETNEAATPPAPETPANDAAPTPVNRIVKPGMVKVRACEPIGEMVNGEIVRVGRNETIELPEERVRALGPLVSRDLNVPAEKK